MNNKLKRTATIASEGLQMRKADDGKQFIEGYAIVFGKRSMRMSGNAYEVIDASAVTQEFIDKQDIVFNYEHKDHRLLGRCINGEGTFSATVDDKGVRFSLELPDTADGKMVAEHVRRGDIRGCSFCFFIDLNDPDAVGTEKLKDENGLTVCIYHIRSMAAITDFTLTVRPAYPDTEVKAAFRSMTESFAPVEVEPKTPTVDYAALKEQARYKL